MQTRFKIVAFDLYGTLIQFNVIHRPFRKILQWAAQQGRQPQIDDARFLMTVNDDPINLFSELGIFPPEKIVQQFHQEVQDELANVQLFDDVIPTLNALVKAGIKLAICSNLAKPYGEVIDRLLGQYDFNRVLSYQAGFIKPENEIYDLIINNLDLSKKDVLFVGDTYLADVKGPAQYGFTALHLVREEKSNETSIESLREILCRLENFG